MAREGIVCASDLTGMPFVASVVSYSDFCAPCSGDTTPAGESTVTMSFPDSGMLCLSGQVSPGGIAGVNLGLATRTQDGSILKPFDAAGRDITQVALTIDSPPSAGVAVKARMVTHVECPNDPLACSYPPDFEFKTISVPGPVVAPLDDFKAVDSTLVLDTHTLSELVLQVFSGDYDFCIHDFKFLDAQGNEVKP